MEQVRASKKWHLTARDRQILRPGYKDAGSEGNTREDVEG